MPESLVLITGAGASTELGQDGRIPLMPEWSDNVVNKLDVAMHGLAHELGLARGMGSAFEEKIGDFLKWERALSTVDKLARLGEETFDPLKPTFPIWVQKARERAKLVNSIMNQSLTECFGSPVVNVHAASVAYSELFTFLKMGPGTVPTTVATTNYDFVAEEALSRLRMRPVWGEESPTSTTGASPTLNFGNLAGMAQLGNVPVLHLHGRVAWYVRESDDLCSLPPNTPYGEIYGAPGLLLPEENKNYDEDSYFRVVWDEFEKALAGASHVFVMGHSLHDEGLVEALRTTQGQRLLISYCPSGTQDANELQAEANRAAEEIRGTHRLDARIIPLRFRAGFLQSVDKQTETTLQHWRAGNSLGFPNACEQPE